MRQIKFRAWEKPGIVASSSEGSCYFNGKMHDVTPYPLNSFFDYCLERPHEYELLQFTGLLDKNGKEIYEGDILKWNKYEWYRSPVLTRNQIDELSEHFDTVGWNNYYAQFDMPSKSDLEQHCEVIGNIYESPELLTP